MLYLGIYEPEYGLEGIPSNELFIFISYSSLYGLLYTKSLLGNIEENDNPFYRKTTPPCTIR